MFLKTNTMNNSLADEIDAVLSNDLPEESQNNSNNTLEAENVQADSFAQQKVDEISPADEVNPSTDPSQNNGSSIEHEDASDESQSNGNDISDVANIQESSHFPQERESIQSTGVTSKKRVGKYYGVRLQDAIRWGWMDATFALERKINEFHRNRVQRAAAKIKKGEEKFYADCNKIAAMRNASENTEDNE